MMKFTVTIETDNDSFTNGNLGCQTGDILQQLGHDLRQLSCTDTEFTGNSGFVLRDRNGNTVGHAEHTRYSPISHRQL